MSEFNCINFKSLDSRR